MAGLTLITPPAIEPLSIVEAKLHLRVNHSAEDGYIGDLITAAREHIEEWCWLSLLTQTWKLSFDHFPGHGLYGGDSASFGGAAATYALRSWFALPRPPLLGITNLKYIASDGTLTTLDPSAYQVDTDRQPGRIGPGINQLWPWLELSWPQEVFNAVQITFTSGYGAGSVDGAGNTTLPPTCPHRAKARQTIRLIVGHWFENRETVLTGVRAAGIEVPESAKTLMWAMRTAL
jgi:hypothetical protein